MYTNILYLPTSNWSQVMTKQFIDESEVVVKSPELSDSQKERVESYIRNYWFDENSTDILKIMIDQEYFKLAIHYLVGAGAIEPEHSSNPKIERLCLRYIDGYTFEDDKRDTKDLLEYVNPALFINDKTNEHYWLYSESDFDPDTDTKFVGYWKDYKPE